MPKITYIALPMLVRDRSAYSVKLDGTVAGRIMPVEGGYRYQPKGNYNNAAAWGRVFETLDACKADVEGRG